jgi:hypothetical protein
MELSADQIEKIVFLGIGLKPEHYRSAAKSRITFYREMKYQDLLCSIHVDQGVDDHRRDIGIHICIMNNGDIFARIYPYYDGTLDNLIMVYNQAQIRDIIFS